MCTEENTALNMYGFRQIIHAHQSTWQIISLSFLSRSSPYVIQSPNQIFAEVSYIEPFI